MGFAPIVHFEYSIAMNQETLAENVSRGTISLAEPPDPSSIVACRRGFMDTPTFSAALQVMLGGILVFIAGVPIGDS